MLDTILSYPLTYLLSLLLALALAIEVGIKPGIAWRVPFLGVVGTVFAWYLVEPIYTPEQFTLLSTEDVSTAFLGVILFLLSFRIFVPMLAGRFDRLARQPTMGLSPEVAQRVLIGAAALWVVLATIGSARMDWNVSAALFPNGRTDVGSMWARGAVADGGGDSFVAAAGYIYILLLAIFGILASFVRGKGWQALCIVLIVVSWPYAFLIGARNIALAVAAPGFLAFLLYGRSHIAVKILVTIVAYVVIDELFRLIITYRNIGFDHIGDANVKEVNHAGLNMASELTNIVAFLRVDVLQWQWGYGYLADLTQLIPRAIWPDKPLIGIDYAIARGFAASNTETGVNTTISQGMIGGGVRQLGPIFGPPLAAFIMALWARILTQLRVDYRISRACLYLLGLGLTFNLGRDITLLVLWPFVFAYVGVLLYERATQNRRVAALA